MAVKWLGRVPYREAWALQEALRRRVIDGEPAETILLLEHPPVITLGRAANPSNVLLEEAALAARGIELVRSTRGGDVTWHGPGQLVAYPVVRLHRGVVAHVTGMAEAVIEVVRTLGVEAEFRRERAGVWVGDRKLCAFGVHVGRGVAIHGLALNLTTAPGAFSLIVPCGLRDAGVTSVAELTGASPTVESLAEPLAVALLQALGRARRDDADPCEKSDRGRA